LATICYASSVRVPPDVAWDFLERYIHSKVRAFSACLSERQEGDFHLVTLADGVEARERNISVDTARMRAVYAVPWLLGTQHHRAEMRVVPQKDGGAIVEWTTDIVPHKLAEVLRKPYSAMFDELVTAVNRQRIEDA
jgi:Polyketide cyclase / dehydrase and lipid transport